MKKIILLLLIVLFSQTLWADVYEERQERTEWFRDARFGMFIHWGIYAIPARGEWVRNKEKISVKDYQPYFDSFNPIDYNPREWARAAKDAGMKYAVMTAKHHDGFCLFDSKYTDYKATNTPAGRDLMKEYVEAFRAEGLKVGFYYSLLDWHHPDYPHYGDGIHPMSDNEEWKDVEHDFKKYVEYMHNQVRELQPGVIIDNRLGGKMEVENPEPYAGDFAGPEQVIPHRPIVDELGRPIPWEACITLNNNWGYATNDDYKSPTDVVRTLVNVVSKGGNLLLNVGPDARGNIPQQSLDILEEVGDWMDLHSESIYGCGPAPFPKPEWGRFTMKGDTLFAHILDTNIGQYYMQGMKGKITQARLLYDGREIFIGPYWHGERSYIDADDTFFNLGNPPQWTFIVPDRMNTVAMFKLIQK